MKRTYLWGKRNSGEQLKMTILREGFRHKESVLGNKAAKRELGSGEPGEVPQKRASPTEQKNLNRGKKREGGQAYEGCRRESVFGQETSTGGPSSVLARLSEEGCPTRNHLSSVRGGKRRGKRGRNL